MNSEKITPTLWQVAKSVLMAFLGVQRNEIYERDFKHGKPWQYIVIGLVFVTLFVFSVVLVVRLVLSMAGV